MDKYKIYTLRGTSILNSLKKSKEPGTGLRQNTYVIDIADEFGKYTHLIRESSWDEDILYKEDTAFYYQILRIILKDNPDISKDKPDILIDKVVIVDFKETIKYLPYPNHAFHFDIHKDDRRHLNNDDDDFNEDDYDDDWIPEDDDDWIPNYDNSDIDLFLDGYDDDDSEIEYFVDDDDDESVSDDSEIEHSDDDDDDDYNRNAKKYEWNAYLDNIDNKIGPGPRPYDRKVHEKTNTMFETMGEEGFKIRFWPDGDEDKFMFITGSPSMLRKGRLVAVRKDIYDKLFPRLDLGLVTGNITYSKLLSYLGLYLSSGKRIGEYDNKNNYVIKNDKGDEIKINEETVVIVKDIETTSNKINTITMEKIENTVEEKEQEIIINPFDGEGIVSDTAATIINDLIGSKDLNSFQIRMPFIKGMVHRVDFHEFLKQFANSHDEKYVIEDIFGNERDLGNAHFILTESMFKLYSLMDDPGTHNMKEYFDIFSKYHHAIYISNTEKPYINKKLVNLNYQFLCTLDLNSENISKLLEEHGKYVENPIDYLRNYADIWANDDIFDNDDNPDNDSSNYNAPQEDSPRIPSWEYALFNNESFSEDSFIRSQLKRKQESIIQKARKGRLLVPGEIRFLSGDLLCFLYHLLNLLKNNIEDIQIDNTEELKDDECYIPGSEMKNDKYYPIFRSPHLSRNEQCLLKVKSFEKETIRDKYLGHLKGCIMVSVDSLSPNILGGADFDGDLVKIIDEDIIKDAVIRGVYNNNEDGQLKRTLPIVKIPHSEDSLRGTNKRKWSYEIFYNLFSNRIGEISNIACKIGQLEYSNKKPEMDLSCSTAACTIITGMEIDACKTGYHPNKEINKLKNYIKQQTLPVDYISDYKKELSSYYSLKTQEAGKKLGEKLYELKKDKNGNKYFEYSLMYNKEKEPSNSLDRFVLELDRTGENGWEDQLKKWERNKTGETIFFPFPEDQKEKHSAEKKVDQISLLIRAYTKVSNYAKSYGSPKYEPDYRSYLFSIFDEQAKSHSYESTFITISKALKDYTVPDIKELIKNIELEWPYLINDDEKKNFLKELLKFNDDKEVEECKELYDFSHKGYLQLYYYLNIALQIKEQNAENRIKKMEKSINDQKKEGKIPSGMENYFDELYKGLENCISKNCSKREISSKLNKISSKILNGIIYGEKNNRVEYIYAGMNKAVSDDKDNTDYHEFFWNHVRTDELDKVLKKP